MKSDYMRGYERAIRELRDEQAWADWLTDQQRDEDGDLYLQDNLLAAAYLEKRRPTT